MRIMPYDIHMKEIKKLCLILIGPQISESLVNVTGKKPSTLLFKLKTSQANGGAKKYILRFTPINAPKKAARPLPPEKEKKGEYICPKTVTKQAGQANCGYSIAGIKPLIISSNPTIKVKLTPIFFPSLFDITLSTFVVPGFPDPQSVILILKNINGIITANGIAPIKKDTNSGTKSAKNASFWHIFNRLLPEKKKEYDIPKRSSRSIRSDLVAFFILKRCSTEIKITHILSTTSI